MFIVQSYCNLEFKDVADSVFPQKSYDLIEQHFPHFSIHL